MTLNSRNRLFLIGFIVITVQFVSLLATGCIKAALGFLEPFPTDLQVTGSLMERLIGPNYNAGIISLTILSLYSSVCGLVLYLRFEKTIASEIMYFAGFLMGVFLESFRLAIPIFNLWSGFLPVLSWIGKAAFAGRLLTLFCLLFSAFPVSESFVQDTDKNIVICICVAILFAALMPLNTHEILPSVMVSFTFNRLFATIRVLLFIATLITIVFTNRFPRFYGLLITYAGYLLLTVSSSYPVTLAGAVLLVSGSILFLSKLHQFYLWK